MKKTILVVEDDSKMRKALSYWLEHAGYCVTQAPDGKVAISLLEQGMFDVVLTDIIMGSIDGIEVLQVAKKQPYHPTVILLTGHGSLETSIEAIRAGAYDYLLKPCDEDELLRCVEKAVQRHDSENQAQKLKEAATHIFRVLQNHRGTVNDLIEDTPRDKEPEFAPQQAPPLPKESRKAKTFHIGELTVGTTRREVIFQREHLPTTPTEFSLLRYLAERSGQVCSYREIILYTHGIETNTIDAQGLLRTHLRNLRKKLPPGYIVNDRGLGYMLLDPKRSGT